MSMWGIGVARAPRPPTITPPKESKYQKNVQNELEALRQRGLAKLLNKHFTSVTALIAGERAAADAAIRELEEKRRLHKDFASNPSELSAWDKMYVELQQKRAECKRKEKETLLLYQRYVSKFGKSGAITVPTTNEIGNAIHHKGRSAQDVLTSPLGVGTMAGHIEATLAGLMSKGADRHPSIKNIGIDETIQNLQNKAAVDDAIYSKKQLESRAIDAKYRYSPETIKKARAEVLSAGPPISPIKSSKTPTDISNLTLPSSTETDADDETDDRSVVSGLTSINSHVVSDAEQQLLLFLRTETEAIRQMIDQEEMQSVKSGKTNLSADLRSESDRAAKKAEEMVKQMKSMLQEFQQEQVEIVTNEYPYKLETHNPDDNWMVYFDEDHEREYYHETTSNVVQWKKPRVNLSEDSVRTSTTATPADQDYMPMSDFTARATRLTFSPEDVKPEHRIRQSGSARRDLYRKLQRKRRKQRRFMTAMCVLMLCGVGSYSYHRYNTDPAFAARVDYAQSQFQDVFESFVPAPIAEQSRVAYNAIVSYFPGRADDEHASEVESKRLEAERVFKEEAERNATLEAEAKEKERVAADQANERERVAADENAKLETKKRAMIKKKKAALAAKKEKERRAEAQRLAEEAERARKEMEQAERLAAEENAKLLRRPWACNIPLAYIVHPRCRRLSSLNPVYNVKELLDAMMQ